MSNSNTNSELQPMLLINDYHELKGGELNVNTNMAKKIITAVVNSPPNYYYYAESRGNISGLFNYNSKSNDATIVEANVAMPNGTNTVLIEKVSNKADYSFQFDIFYCKPCGTLEYENLKIKGRKSNKVGKLRLASKALIELLDETLKVATGRTRKRRSRTTRRHTGEIHKRSKRRRPGFRGKRISRR